MRTNSHSRGEIDRAGAELLRGYPDLGSNFTTKMKDYRRAFTVMDDWRASHAFPLNIIQVTLRKRVKELAENGEVYQRLKRTPSVISKLKRFPDMKLSRMQDLGGCRAILASLNDIVVIRDRYKVARDRHALVGEKNYIDSPKPSGYRGRHLVYKYQSDRVTTYNNHRIEIQLRTRFQHLWATAVEVAGLYTKSPLKSSVGPDDWLEFFQYASSAIAIIEDTASLHPQYCNTEIVDRLRNLEARLNACSALSAFSSSHKTIQQDAPLGATHFLVEVDYSSAVSTIVAFRDFVQASQAYGKREIEVTSDGDSVDVVLVAAQDVASLARGYPNYFLDTDEFVILVREILEDGF